VNGRRAFPLSVNSETEVGESNPRRERPETESISTEYLTTARGEVKVQIRKIERAGETNGDYRY